MSVENPVNIERRRRTILPGDRVVVISSVIHEYEHETLFGECDKILETFSDMFVGTVKTTPELAADHKGFWEIKNVEGLNFDLGAVRRCVDLVFESNDMSYGIGLIDDKPSDKQLSLRVDFEGALQL